MLEFELAKLCMPPPSVVTAVPWAGTDFDDELQLCSEPLEVSVDYARALTLPIAWHACFLSLCGPPRVVLLPSWSSNNF